MSLRLRRTARSLLVRDAVTRRRGDAPKLHSIVFSFVLLFIACSKITDPTAQPYVKQFTVTGTTPGQQPAFIVTSGPPGRINISGTVPTPTACYTLDPDVALRGFTIQLTLYARPKDPNNPACEKILASITYQGVLGDFTPGAYEVLVSHESGSGPVVDFTKNVDVL